MLEEFRVTLSFAQMAAILTKESLTPEEIRTNRVVGSVRLAAALGEMNLARRACAIPDPLFLGKAACAVIGVHAADQMSAATVQMITGRHTDPFAFKAGASFAESFGASKTVAQFAGMATELAAPISAAAIFNTFRVASVTAGRVRIFTNEILLHADKRLGGGHIIKKHVGKTLEYLQKRFSKGSLKVSSTFYDLPMAEFALSKALDRHRVMILVHSKLKFLLRGKDYVIETRLDRVIGWGVSRNAQETAIEMSKVKVVIRFIEYNHMPYFIVTAFPVL
jgi:hypothetical protein